MVINLSPLINRYGVGLQKLFEQGPNLKKFMTYVDGNIYLLSGETSAGRGGENDITYYDRLSFFTKILRSGRYAGRH